MNDHNAHLKPTLSEMRSERFEELTYWARTLLALSDVQDTLGELGKDLTSLNETAYLPDVLTGVDGGIVGVPKKYQETDSVGILPRFSDDGWLQARYSLVSPPPASRQRMREALTEQAKGRKPTEKRLEEFIGSAIRQMSEQDIYETLLNPDADTAVGSGPIGVCSDEGVLAAGHRLVVVTCDSDHLPIDAVSRGLMVVQRLVHIADMQNMNQLPDTLSTAQTSLRAYCVGAVVLDAAIKQPEVCDERQMLTVSYDMKAVRIAERLCMEYGVNPNALLNIPKANPLVLLV